MSRGLSVNRYFTERVAKSLSKEDVEVSLDVHNLL